MLNTNPRFTHLFRPGRIGSLELKNRIVMAPMGTYLAGRDGLVTERLKAYYAERARGGAGLIIVEVAAVDHPRGRGMTRQLGISDDKFIPGLADLAETVHKHGSKVGIQLHHAGRIAAPFLSGGYEAVAPSVIPLIPKELGFTRSLTLEDISQMVRCFALAAGRARQAGLDGVEIHAGHGYLISEFLSRSSNQRQDAYGGDLDNRARFLLEIISAVRGAVGKDYPVWCRLDGREYSIENGIIPEEALETAQMAEKAGIDAIHVTGYGGSDNVHFTEAPLVYKPGFLVPLARGIKQAVKIPVIAVGRINPEMGEQILRRGEADFIAMGRQLIADPELPQKLASEQTEAIRKCIYCYSCVHQIFVRNNICCAVNPAAGKESEPPPQPPDKVKKVLVIGSGPAGMEAARAAAIRGHTVTLCEKGQRLGGSLFFAAVVRQENEELLQYLVKQIDLLKVAVRTGVTVIPEMVRQIKPDALILASGAVRRNPAIPGIDSRRVINGDDLRQMLGEDPHGNMPFGLTWSQKAVFLPGRWLLRAFNSPSAIRRLSRLWMPLGREVVIIGGGLVGCELAGFLGERGRKVTVLEEGDQLAAEMPLPQKWILMAQLERLGTSLLTGVKCQEITSQGVRIPTGDGASRVIAAGSVIIAAGTEPDPGMLKAFEGSAPEIYVAGDCSKICLIKDSIADGARVGTAL
jgi:2,4-dienoyl-CoA reductase-like NADH-dependent reductase (Old Yellow Enzyme family)/thioredoxin reductase